MKIKKCKKCGKEYKSKRFYELHTKKCIYYKCEHCNKEYKSRSGLSKHVKKCPKLDAIEDIIDVSCDLCHKMFSENEIDSHKTECKKVDVELKNENSIQNNLLEILKAKILENEVADQLAETLIDLDEELNYEFEFNIE
jgi:hypothetical protein